MRNPLLTAAVVLLLAVTAASPSVAGGRHGHHGHHGNRGHHGHHSHGHHHGSRHHNHHHRHHRHNDRDEIGNGIKEAYRPGGILNYDVGR